MIYRPKRVEEFIKSKFKEVHEVSPGYRIFDVFLIGVPPTLIGVDGDRGSSPTPNPITRPSSSASRERKRSKG
ncbi:MAG: DUF1894 domain-containing protein [Methanotrichaceae archaeon]